MKEEKTSMAANQVELDLIDLFWDLFSHWKAILTVALILGLCLGGWKYSSLMKEYQDPSYLAEATESNESSTRIYETNKASLEARIDSILLEQQERADYEAHSALYLIDPYNASVEERSYYIDAGFEIIPDNLYQNPNFNIALVSAYHNAVAKVNVSAILAENGGSEDLSSYDNKGLFLTVKEDAANGLLNIRAIGADPGQASAIIAAAEQAIRDIEPGLQETIHEHSVTLLSANSYQAAADELISLHQSRRNDNIKLYDALNKAVTEYKELKLPSLMPTSSLDAVKSGLKSGLIGLLLGVVLTLLAFAALFILRNRVADAEDFVRRFRLPVLGLLSTSKARLKLDRWIQTRQGVSSEQPHDRQLRLAAANVSQEAGESRKLLLLGSAKPERIAALCAELQPLLPQLQLQAGGNICGDADSVLSLEKSDAVLLVETVASSSNDEIRKELERLSRSGKKLLGCLLLGKAEKKAP